MTEDNSGAQVALDNTGQEQVTEQPEAPQEQPQAQTPDAEPKDTPQDGEEPRKPNGNERMRIKLERERIAREAAERELNELRAKVNPQPAPGNEAPKLENFETWDEYIAARAKHEAQQLLKERDAQDRESKLRDEQKARQQDHDRRTREFAKVTPDFVDTIEDYDGPLTQTMEQAIVESDFGPQIAYYLAKNPAEAEKVSKMSYGEVNRYFGKLETKFEAKPQAVKTTNAPPPIAPARGSVAATLNPYTQDLTPEQYKEWRAKQKR